MKNEQLIFTRIRNRARWDIAHPQPNVVTGAMQWARRDGSTVCPVGSELARQALPKRPKPPRSGPRS